MGIQKRRTGFTLAETVVAMALVAVVSLSTVMTIQTSLHMFQKIEIRQDAIRESENVIVCYQSNNFAAALTFLYGFDVESATEFTVYYSKDGVATKEADSSSTWKLVVTESATALALSSVYLKNEEEIYSTSYAKGRTP